jgi:hypothetical protein
MKGKIKILTPKGVGYIENMYVSELNFLMIRVHIIEENRWISFNLGKHDITDNIFSRIIAPTKWLHQYLVSDRTWYLTHHHPTDGILEEQFFETENELLTYVAKHNITLEYEK